MSETLSLKSEISFSVFRLLLSAFLFYTLPLYTFICSNRIRRSRNRWVRKNRNRKCTFQILLSFIHTIVKTRLKHLPFFRSIDWISSVIKSRAVFMNNNNNGKMANEFAKIQFVGLFTSVFVRCSTHVLCVYVCVFMEAKVNGQGFFSGKCAKQTKAIGNVSVFNSETIVVLSASFGNGVLCVRNWHQSISGYCSHGQFPNHTMLHLNSS